MAHPGSNSLRLLYFYMIQGATAVQQPFQSLAIAAHVHDVDLATDTAPKTCTQRLKGFLRCSSSAPRCSSTAQDKDC